MELTDLTAVEIVAALRAGDVSAEAYLEALLSRIDAHRNLNAFLRVDAEGAREAARAADGRRRRGEPLGALHGLPVVVKDNIDVRGAPTTCNTPVLAENQATANAPVVQALLEAGGVVLGKTNMHELALGSPNDPRTGGDALNPYAPAHMTGGSSSGTAAAVGARLAPGGLGTDTGGSVRIPAALCGIAGLRPTLGRYPTAGVVPVSPTRDTVGPMCRTVADLALFDAAVTRAPAGLEAAPRAPLRLGVPRRYFWERLDPPVAGVAARALEWLREAGSVLVDVEVEEVARLNEATSLPVAFYEAARSLPGYLEGRGIHRSLREVADTARSPGARRTLASLVGEDGISRTAYEAAMTVHRPALREAYRRCFAANHVAALVYPTTPLPARPVEEAETVVVDGVALPTFLAYLRNVDPSSNAGLPGVTVPAGLTAEGLPVGLAFDGPEGSDRELLRIALAYESARPPIPAPRLGRA